MSRPDPVLTEVVARYLALAAEEIAATLVALAFSPNIKERADCSSAIFDAAGRVVAQANRIPIHLGSMIGAIEAIGAKYPAAAMAPGDMFLANDPFNGGGTHLPDLNLVAPVFVDGTVVAFVANIAHHADVGGMVPGSESALCTSIFQEGIRIPVVRVLRGGTPDPDILDLVLLNSRTPEERMGDLQAQFAANRVGAERVAGLFAKYPRAVVEGCIEGFLAATGQRFAAAVAALPDGSHEAEEALDEGDAGQPARLHLRLTVGGGRLRFDFTGSAPQLTGSSRNVPRKAVLAVVYAVAKSLLDPDVPPNAGYYDAIEVVTRPGTLLDPVAPAAVGTRAITCGVLGDLIVAAMGRALGGAGMADSGPHHLVILSGPDPRHGGVFVDYETIAGGSGGRGRGPGMDAVRVHASGAANLPVEALENAYPLRVERYALRQGSGGDGRNRGGHGVVRDWRVLTEGVTVSLSSERQRRPARGTAGGGDGATGAFLLNPGTERERRLPSAAVDLPLAPGDVLRVLTPGGGGFGKAD
ncbi:hydantoinase B/oxoprolinase family protein [Falsiroseomonas sp. CW058]|uniref:hydantoinase B/oxoprolinase family protein n=1 Tax=Falsiroseomonas sp. CW058 TaxID=3388664 RepID=UPI003D31535D